MKQAFIILLSVLLFSCSKEDTRTLLASEHFELDECFSTLTLNGSEVVISDEESYLEFQDSIKRHFYTYCDTTFLPEINFEEFFFMGKYTSTSGCDAEYSRLVYYNEDSGNYEYEIQVSSEGLCEMLISSFNCAIVPKQSGNEEVNFNVLYK
jgi:hypothetical protein